VSITGPVDLGWIEGKFTGDAVEFLGIESDPKQALNRFVVVGGVFVCRCSVESLAKSGPNAVLGTMVAKASHGLVVTECGGMVRYVFGG
jgi:hypothetical protein